MTTSPSSQARVAVIGCATYDESTVEAAIKRGIELLGGIGQFFEPGKTVLFKPNMLTGAEPYKAVTTHPNILKGVVKQFIGAGAPLSYGDSPGGIPNIEQTYRKCGYTDALAGIPITLGDFRTGAAVVHPEGITSKRLVIARAVLNAGSIINLPKLKAHGLTRMTGAVKNLYGCVPGVVKGEYHARFPDVYDFSQLLADIATFVRPRLHILDAVDAMEGNGPQSGTLKHLGVLLFATDPVALDAIACKLINLDTSFVPTIAAGERSGLGTGNLAAIKLLGDNITPLVSSDFDVVRFAPPRLPSNRFLRQIKRFFLERPVVTKTACIHCGKCVALCPVMPKAIKLSSKDKTPRYNYGLCVRCFCCQEICPAKAITIKSPLGKKLFPFFTYFALIASNNNSSRNSKGNRS